MKKIVSALAMATALFTGAAMAEDSYPTQAVTLTIPYGPGGASDLAGRALAESAKGYLGQPITVVNKPGAVA